MVNDLKYFLTLRQGGDVINGRRRIEYDERNAVYDASRDQYRITPESGEDNQSGKPGNTKYQTKAMRNCICEFFDRESL